MVGLKGNQGSLLHCPPYLLKHASKAFCFKQAIKARAKVGADLMWHMSLVL